MTNAEAMAKSLIIQDKATGIYNLIDAKNDPTGTVTPELEEAVNDTDGRINAAKQLAQ